MSDPIDPIEAFDRRYPVIPRGEPQEQPLDERFLLPELPPRDLERFALPDPPRLSRPDEQAYPAARGDAARRA